ncbi:amidase [Flavobacteriaceae bacterium MAR_2010_188]|nr:amidase [Flavobacteriaceae bacterium MAR_2010_188]
MKNIYLIFLLLFIFNCKDDKNESSEVVNTADTVESKLFHKVKVDSVVAMDSDFREFKVLDSRNLDVEVLWAPFNKVLDSFSEQNYESLKPLVLDQDILTMQKSVADGNLNYEQLTLFYLYRIRELDRNNEKSLNSVISINPAVLDEAKERDRAYANKKLKHSVYGMPILLKDNINAEGMTTTAGAVVFEKNLTHDSFISEQLTLRGAIILGKTNLSEWAYFFCGDCPSGYSAIGGQTLNPYGRRTIDTGGSSSGSGVAVAANFCAGAIGSETSGSILSPSSQNSIVGLKPTIGILSRSGIVPISSTLDTPGPMTKNVTDTAIILDAMLGMDVGDVKTQLLGHKAPIYRNLSKDALKGVRLGAAKRLMDNSLYAEAIQTLRAQGAEVIEFEEEKLELPDFVRLLNLEMKKELPRYILGAANTKVGVVSVIDIIKYNKTDSTNSAPYGQKLFNGIVADSGSSKDLDSIHNTLRINGKLFFDKPFQEHELDGFLSINNYHAGFAAVAEYPAITVPMGYAEDGSPKGLTFISTPKSEENLLNWAFAYEQASKKRVAPSNYK